MIKRLTLLGCALLLLAGCATISQSRFNPFNWFSQSEEVETLVPVTEVPQDPRPLIAQVTGLRLDRTPGGAIVVARGLAPRQGYFDGALVAAPQSPAGVLDLRFLAAPPETVTGIGPPQSRELVVGYFVSDQDLAGIRQIRVLGADGGRVLRR